MLLSITASKTFSVEGYKHASNWNVCSSHTPFATCMFSQSQTLQTHSARRLGNGAAFYGKRKSNFYGNNDKNKKQSSEFDAAEDYFGPSAAGYFQWMPDADGKLRPVTRMKKQVVEKRRRQRKDGSNS
jgi:hypothetical protein